MLICTTVKVFCSIFVHREMSINRNVMMGNLACLYAITLQTMSMCPGSQQVTIQNKIIL